MAIEQEAHMRIASCMIGSLLTLGAVTAACGELAALCPWAPATIVGALPGWVNEASGIAASAHFPGRLYHVSDSGEIDASHAGRGFVVTEVAGTEVHSVAIDGYDPRDLEDLAIGVCPDGRGDDCLYLADIGDNARRRDEIAITIIREQAEYPAPLRPVATLRLRYPDGPQDAESLAVQPDGSLLILTKEYRFEGGLRAGNAARLYRLAAASRQAGGTGPMSLDHVVDLDFAALRPEAPPRTIIATAMDLSRDGRRALILFYDDAIELALDAPAAIPATAHWQEGAQFQRIALLNQLQQEAITYGPDGQSLYYTTERPFGRGNEPTPLLRTECLR
jgi:hypothetical protein